MEGPELPTKEIVPVYISWNSNFLLSNCHHRAVLEFLSYDRLKGKKRYFIIFLTGFLFMSETAFFTFAI